MKTLIAQAHRVPILRTLLTVLAANVVLTGLLFVGTAGATLRPVIEVAEGKSFASSYGPIALQNPALATVVGSPEPADCNLPASFCDTIPVKVTLPDDYDPELTYLFTTVELTWAQPPASNDLDMYIWAEDEEGALHQVGSSATGAKPERANTEEHEFFIVVNNFSGANDGYSLKVDVTVERLGAKPFELLEPEGRSTFVPAGASDDGALSSPEPQETASFGGPSPIAQAARSTAGIAPSVQPVSAAPLASPEVPNFAGTSASAAPADVDFAPASKGKNALAGAATFGGAATAAAEEAAIFQSAASKRDVPTGVLVLWLGVLPLVLVALFAVYLVRRGSAGLAV